MNSALNYYLPSARPINTFRCTLPSFDLTVIDGNTTTTSPGMSVGCRMTAKLAPIEPVKDPASALPLCLSAEPCGLL